MKLGDESQLSVVAVDVISGVLRNLKYPEGSDRDIFTPDWG